MCTEEIEKYKASKSAEDLLEDVIDTLCEVGNGVDDDMLHDAADRLFAFRDLWKEERKRIAELEAVLREVADCSSYWSEYFVPIGLPEKIETALKQEEK